MSRWVTCSTDVYWHGDYKTEPAVYAIYVDGVLSYVGQTVNLRNRMKMHNIRFSYGNSIIIPWGDGCCKSCVVKASYSLRYGDWAMRELRLIRRLSPQYNVLHANKRKAA